MAAEIAVHPDKPVVSFEPQHSNDKASTGDTSNTLNVALESSMKIWQVTVSTLCNITTLHCIILQPSGSRVVGGLFSHVHSNSLETTPSHLSAALDYSWMDFPKPNTGYKQGKREYYPRGKTLSQTTIPLAKYLSFSYQVFLWFFFCAGVDECSVSSGSRSTSHSPSPTPSSSNSSSSFISQQKRSSPTVLIGSSRNSAIVSLPSSGSLPTETFSRKVFVGGLPPDIDQGASEVQSALFCCDFLFVCFRCKQCYP